MALKPAVIVAFNSEDEIERVMFFHDHNDAVTVWADSGLKNAVLTVVEIYEQGQLPANLPLKQQMLPMEAADVDAT